MTELLSKAKIEGEVQRRAAEHLPQTHLVADYYRIRRRVAFPLPIREIHLPAMPVPGIAEYPWSIWMLWDLEERVHALGWAATWWEDDAMRRAVVADLEGLASWPSYMQYDRPDLSLGHTGRLLWYALRSWPWVDRDLRATLRGAMTRHVDEGLPFSRELHGTFTSADDILALDEPHSALHNIPFIGNIGMALCAGATGHPAGRELDDRVETLLTAFLSRREYGHTEGVGYDGYIFDFVVPWLSTLEPSRRDAIVSHPRFADLLDESLALGVPGDAAHVAPIGDVEPKEMPYHLSAHAKGLEIRYDARALWLLRRCRADWLRCDALAALRDRVDAPEETSTTAAPADAHYAVSLRSGWRADDIVAVASYSNSPMGHLQLDAGTVTIGSRGAWLIGDPGYQQYMKKQERTFTLGESAHNAPVIDGVCQTRRLTQRQFSIRDADGATRADMDLSEAYQIEGISCVSRTLWVDGSRCVVLCDRVGGQGKHTLTYHWQGDPDGAWWCAGGVARLYVPGVTLWIACSGSRLKDSQIDRMPGSRGHLTLRAQAVTSGDPVTWVFVVSDMPPDVRFDGGAAIVNGRTFRT